MIEDSWPAAWLQEAALDNAPAPIPNSLGDADRLAQVFINLASNAEKYCDAEAPELRIDVVQGRTDVEIVFADRNERQRMLLVPERGGWAIASLEQAQMLKPPIPYGTPVFEPPEPQQAEAE